MSPETLFALFLPCLYHVDSNSLHTAKNAKVATGLLTSCNRLDYQADINMRSHGLRQLFDDASVTDLLQVDCQKLLSERLTKSCGSML